MKSTSFRLPDSTYDLLCDLARKLDMTLTQAVIVAIDRLAAATGKKPAK